MGDLSKTRERGAGDEARNRKLSSLRAFFKSLIEMERLSNNPAVTVAKSKQEKNRIPVYLDENQLEFFLRSIEGRYERRNLAIFFLMSYAGLRVGEVHRLNIQDLHQDGSIHILGKGRRLSIRMIQTIANDTFTKLKEEFPGLVGKKLSSHKLRHLFATMQIRNGTDIRTVQELLGHSSIETTQIYTHVDNKQLQNAMKNISSRIPTLTK